LENILIGIHYHLWFIGSLLFGYLSILYIYYIKKAKFLTFISVIVLILAVFCDSYDVVFGVSFDFILSRFLISIPFLYLGVILSKSTFYLGYTKLLRFIVIIGIIIQFIEAYFFKLFFKLNIYNTELTVGTIIASVSLFALCLSINLKESRLTKWGKEHSLSVYLYHPVLYFIMVIFFKKLVPEKLNLVLIFFPLIGFIMTLSTSILLNKFLPNFYKILNGNIGEARFKFKKKT
jgi:hypothetical protein